MDEQTLERLMIDQSLGALLPDVSSLLAAYATSIPGGDSQIASWQRLAAQARQAMPNEPIEILPPFPAPRPVSQVWRMTRIGLAAAALLAIGVGVGLWVPHQISRQMPDGVELAIKAQTVSTEIPRAVGVQNFWSSQRLLASAQQPKHELSPAWRWTSPVTEPEIGALK